MAPKPHPKTIVLKLGTSSIISATPPHLPLLTLLSSIVETCVHLRSLGHRVVLVSSGAIGVGMRRMGLEERGKGLQRKQALAAIGQGRLIGMWDSLFGQMEQPIAQVLLTRMDISDRTRYLNAQNTFTELLAMGVIPIVNENDTVAVSEIKFGDNDTLSAISANMVQADYLFLMTDVDCLYTDNPRKNPDAKQVRVVRDIQKCREQVSISTLGTSLGTGGMSTKLIAAELATAAGVTTVIMRTENVAGVFEIIELPELDGEGEGEGGMEVVGAGEGRGPVCTRFLRKENRLADRKWWIAHGLHSAGSVTIDEGAGRAIQRKESGGRILPSGVISVEGTFASHQAVRLFVRRRVHSGASSGSTSHVHAQPRGGTKTPDLSGFSTPSTAGISSPINGVTIAAGLSKDRASSKHTDSPTFSQPQTPNLNPILSLSSSIASLEGLSMNDPNSPAMLARRAAGNVEELHGAAIGGRVGSEKGKDRKQKGKEEEEWETVEIGKGLALYNSAEIDRIKGLKSTDIAHVLGYSETAHVVDSIAFVDLHSVT